MISLAGGNPSPRTFPGKELSEIAAALLEKQGSRILQYGATRGVPEFLEYMKERNKDIMTPDDDIITLTGSSQGIDLFARTYLNDGDTVLVEAPTFLGALQTFLLSKARIETVRLEDDGVDLNALEEKVRDLHPKFFYTIPTFQNPTGITTVLSKRKAIYDICSKYGAAVLEDDPYGRLRYDGERIQPIKSFDDGHTVTHLASFSKTISPGIRVGYAVGPKDVIAHLELIKQGADVHTPNLNQEIVLEYLKTGAFEQHVEDCCSLYRRQRDAMLNTLKECAPEGMTYTVPDGGLFLWATLPEGTTAQGIFDACVESKVVFVPGTPFYADGAHERTLRLNFSMPDEEEVRVGTERLCRVVEEAARTNERNNRDA